MQFDSESGCTQRDTTLTPPPVGPTGGARKRTSRPRLPAYVRQCQTAFTEFAVRDGICGHRTGHGIAPRAVTRPANAGRRRARDGPAFLLFRKPIALHHFAPRWCSLKTRRGPASRVPADDSLSVPTAGLGTFSGKSSPDAETPNSPKSCDKRLRIRLVILGDPIRGRSSVG